MTGASQEDDTGCRMRDRERHTLCPFHVLLCQLKPKRWTITSSDVQCRTPLMPASSARCCRLESYQVSTSHDKGVPGADKIVISTCHTAENFNTSLM